VLAVAVVTVTPPPEFCPPLVVAGEPELFELEHPANGSTISQATSTVKSL